MQPVGLMIIWIFVLLWNDLPVGHPESLQVLTFFTAFSVDQTLTSTPPLGLFASLL